jgi:hypothetical protein
MRGKHVFLSGLVLTVLSLGIAHGQNQPANPATGLYSTTTNPPGPLETPLPGQRATVTTYGYGPTQPSNPANARYSPPTLYPPGPLETPPPNLGPTPYTSGTPLAEIPESGGENMAMEPTPLPQYSGSQLPGSVPPTLDPNAPVPLSYATQMDPWLTYPRWPGCCCHVGGNGPLGYEMYIRSGLSFPVGGGLLNHTMNMGWNITGGARTLFFNPERTSAWTIDLGITNIHNNSSYPISGPPDVLLTNVPVKIPSPTGFGSSSIRVPRVPVTVCDLNQTYVNASLGKEWYLIGCGGCSGQQCNWRVGCDLGGRYGSGKVEFDQIQHRTNALYGAFMAIHTDIEYPCGCCIFYGGIRGEYGSTWDNLLQPQNNGNIQYLNLMFSLGMRF